ncbi:hypothetical protein DJ70_07905 [Halorubrum halodurans]|uniref:Uncharacterized protein n=1 Tax=Halorubrum halodurans TaxID=1383851 RepID=A0A256IJ94_9EURY|nr:hypothetical protein DJ70_07905 [Halorubrum halodurans]
MYWEFFDRAGFSVAVRVGAGRDCGVCGVCWVVRVWEFRVVFSRILGPGCDEFVLPDGSCDAFGFGFERVCEHGFRIDEIAVPVTPCFEAVFDECVEYVGVDGCVAGFLVVVAVCPGGFVLV